MSDEKVVELKQSTDEVEDDKKSSSQENENKQEEKKESAKEGAEEGAKEASEDASGGKGKRKKKNDSAAYLLEVIAVVLLFYFALTGLSGKIRFKKFAPFKVETVAYVERVNQIEFAGTQEEALKLGDIADSKYEVVFVYDVGGQIHSSSFYSKAKPDYYVGQEVTLYVDATDLDSIISVK